MDSRQQKHRNEHKHRDHQRTIRCFHGETWKNIIIGHDSLPSINSHTNKTWDWRTELAIASRKYQFIRLDGIGVRSSPRSGRFTR